MLLSVDLAKTGGLSKDGGAREHQEGKKTTKKNEAGKPMLTTVKLWSDHGELHKWPPQPVRIFSTSKVGLTHEATAEPQIFLSEMSESYIYSIWFWSVPLWFTSSHIIVYTYRDTHTDLPVVTRQGHSVCDGLSQAKVTSFNANALFSPLLMSGCDS